MKKIDYFCFSVPRLETTDYVVNEDDNENLRWIKTKDLEMMEKARQNQMLLIFDRTSKKFYLDGKEFDVKGKTIYPKVFIPYEKELLQALEENGANSIQTLKDRQDIFAWPTFFQPKHRKAVYTTYKEFQENHKKYKEMFDHLFLKTAEKSHHHYFLKYYGEIDLDGLKLFFTKPPIMNMPDEQKIVLSEEYFQVEDKENGMHCKEYRAFVVDGEILSMSRSYIDYPTQIPDQVIEFAEGFVKEISNTYFPKSYGIDFGQLKIAGKEVIDLIECNPITSSGLEVCHDIVGEVLKRQNNIEN